MGSTIRKRIVRGAAGLACVLAAGFSNAGEHDRTIEWEGSGDNEEGSITLALYRGVAPIWELTVDPTLAPDGEMTVKFDWDRSKNELEVTLKGKKVLKPYPSVRREEGTTYFPNRFWPEQQNFDHGRYQLWLLSPARPITLYYDPETLDLMGSEFDFPTPPSPIALMLPTIAAVPTPFFEPKSNGDVNEHWTIPYDHIARQDNPTAWGNHYVTVPPPNLCFANPFRLDQSVLRPYMSPPVPPAQSLGWDHWIRSGIFVDITFEPPQYYVVPPKATMVGSFSGATGLGGSVPKGWSLDLNAIFGNQAPAIVPWEARGSSQPWTYVRTNPPINFCQAQQAGRASVMQAVSAHNALMTGGAQ